MLSKIVTIVLPIAAMAAASAFLPDQVAQAYPGSCLTNWETCKAQATTPRQSAFCEQAYIQCTGGAMPPNVVDPMLGNLRKH